MTLTNETYLDSVAMFTCSAGYSLVGMAEIPCIWNNDTGDPEWNGSIPSCQPIGMCFFMCLRNLLFLTNSLAHH